MKQIMTVDQYVQLGGDVSLLDLKATKVTNLRDEGRAISQIIDLGEIGLTRLFDVYFVNGTQHRYAGMWIETTVELVLAPQYIVPVLDEYEDDDDVMSEWEVEEYNRSMEEPPEIEHVERTQPVKPPKHR